MRDFSDTLMKGLLVAGGLLGGLFGHFSNGGLEKSINQGSSLERSSFEKISEGDGLFVLSENELILQGLRDFYSASMDADVQDLDVWDNVVSLNVEGDMGGRGHGYMINDCGLILTANHVVRGLENNPFLNGTVTTREGDLFQIRNTEISDSFLDFAIVYAETGNESKANPLNFLDTSFVPCGNDARFIAMDFSRSEELEYNDLSGNVVCYADILEKLKGDGWTHTHGLYAEEFIRKGSILLDTDLKKGYSGSPVFSNVGIGKPEFLGLVRGGLTKNKYINNNPRTKERVFIDDFTAITTSKGILDNIGNYLEDLDSP